MFAICSFFEMYGFGDIECLKVIVNLIYLIDVILIIGIVMIICIDLMYFMYLNDVILID